MSDLDTNNDGNPLASEYQNLAMNAHLEFRPNENTSAVLSGGYSDAGGIFIQDQDIPTTKDLIIGLKRE